jgi:integrase
MGTVYKKTFTKPLPEGAEMFSRNGQQFARWKPEGGGRTRTAGVTSGKDGSPRVILRAGTYTAKYRDSSGRVIEVATRCRDEGAARAILTDLERRSELVRAGVMTAGQDAAAGHESRPLAEHLAAYVEHLRAKGVNADRLVTTERRLEKVAEECKFGRLSDLAASELERWLLARRRQGASAAVWNGHRECWVAFANWCRRTHRLLENPFLLVPKADQKADPRRKRRALTEPELERLIEAARTRPLLVRGARNRGPKKGQSDARLTESTRKKLELLGHERALIYKTFVLTGLRRGELASLSVGQIDLGGPVAWATLDAADEKNREGSEIPLRADLAADLKDWLERRLKALQEEAKRKGEPIPVALPPDAKLFRVPEALVKILDRDLEAAGIPKRDARGRTVDVHALRHTFGTHLSKGGVPLRTAQAAMRHSDPSLTANVYTDPQLLDVAGALEALPALPLSGAARQQSVAAVGSGGASALAPVLAPTLGFSGASGSFADRTAVTVGEDEEPADLVLSAAPVTPCPPLTTAGRERRMVGVIGFEPTTSASRTQRSEPG